MISKIIKEWTTQIWDNRSNIDPDNEIDWKAFAIGWALGRGLNIDQAEIFFGELLELDIV